MKFRLTFIGAFLLQLCACQDLHSARSVQAAQLARDAEGAYRNLDFDEASRLSDMLTSEEKVVGGVYVDLLIALRRFLASKAESDYLHLDDLAGSYLDFSARLGADEARNARTNVAMIKLAADEIKGVPRQVSEDVCGGTLDECSCRKTLLTALSREADSDFLAAEVGFFVAESSVNQCPSIRAELLGYRDALGIERGFETFDNSSAVVRRFVDDAAYAMSFCRVYNEMVSPSSSRLNQIVLRRTNLGDKCSGFTEAIKG